MNNYLKNVIILLGLIVILVTGCSSLEGNAPEVDKDVELISTELLFEDLEFLYTTYMEKNLSMRDEETVNSFKNAYQDLIDNIQPMDIESFYFEVSKLAALTDDGHASIRYTDETKMLPIALKWLEEGLVITKTIGDNNLKAGDTILEINGKATELYLEELSHIIPHENIHGLKFASSRQIANRHYLKYLNGIDKEGKVPIKVVDINGNTSELKLEFIERKNPANSNSSPNTNQQGQQPPKQGQKPANKSGRSAEISYKFIEESNTGFIKIKKCALNDKDKKDLKEFFNEVSSRGSSNIILDLRENSGGQTHIIDEFLKYIDVDKAQYWKNDLIDFGVKTIEHYSDDLYSGDIYVATSNNTLSSALMFTATLKYNNLAKSIGSPTGQATIFYGRATRTELPNTKLSVGETRVKVFMQNEEYPDTIAPDISLPITAKDIAENTDPVIEWAKKLTSK